MTSRAEQRRKHVKVSETKEKLGIQSAEVSATILAALTRIGRPCPLRDLAREAGMPSAKVHRYLVSLVRADLVYQNKQTGHYSIGQQAILMGLTGLRSLNVVNLASEFLVRLRDQIGETAVLAIWTDDGPIVVQFEESERPVYMNVRVGSVLPLSQTAIGKVFAAFVPESVVEPMLAGHPKHRLGRDAAKRFRAELEKVRRDRVASVAGTLVDGVSAIGAPVFDHRHRIVAAIGVIAQDTGPGEPDLEQRRQVLHDVAEEFSSRLGDQGPLSDDVGGEGFETAGAAGRNGR